MKRCIEAHHVATFGDIPVGSLWADDSPYVTDDALFVDADAPEVPEVDEES
jgi:hypothetical protein